MPLLNNTLSNPQSPDRNIVEFLNNITYDFDSSYSQAYVINLDRSHDRWLFTSNQLEQAGIKFERFSAIDGYKSKIKDIQTGEELTGQELKNTLVTTKENHEYQITCKPDQLNSVQFNYLGKISAGELGCLSSHIVIWKNALLNNYSRIVIFEDDILINTNEFSTQLNNFLSNIPNNFDVAFMGYYKVDGEHYPLKDNDYVSAVSDDFLAWGTYAAVYSKKGMEKLLTYTPYDEVADIFQWQHSSYTNPQGLIIYVSENNFVEALGGESTISEMGRGYESYYYNIAL